MATLTTSYQKVKETKLGSWGYGTIYLRTYAKINSQSIEDNTTSYSVQSRIYNNGTECYSGNCYNVLQGVNKKNNVTLTFTKSSEITLGTVTNTVAHNVYGDKSISLTNTFKCYALGSTTYNANVTVDLPSIPRATVPTLSASSIELGQPITINTPRVVDNFTHELYYEVNGKSAKTQFAVGVTTGYTWEDTLFLANFIDTSESGTITIHCETYNGTELVGKKSVTFTGNVPSSIVPEIETFTVEEYVTDVADKVGKYLKGKSQLSINASAKGRYGATIVSYKINANDETFTSSSAVTSILNSSGVQMVSVTVTDSRGRTSTKGISIGVVDYFAPKAGGLSVYRCDSSGTLKDNGTYVKAYINYEIAPIENLNSKKAMVQYLNGEEWVTVATFTDTYTASSRNHIITNTTFNVDNTYKFRLVVEDYFSSDDWNALPLPTSYTLMNYHQSGKAIGFGKVATREEGFQFGDFVYDQWDTVITNGLAVYGGDPDTTLESLIMTSTNSPNGEAMFFHTFFSSNKTDTQNCGQFAIPYYYNGTQSMYWRYRFGGTWSEWVELANKSQVDKLSVKGNFITVALSLDYTIPANSEYATLPFDTVYFKNGSSLSLQDDGGILIGEGVSSVAVSGQWYYYTGTSSQKIVQILKNEEVVSRNQKQQVPNYTTIDAPTQRFNVSKGDVIYLQALGTKSDLVKNYPHTTHLSVEVIA